MLLSSFVVSQPVEAPTKGSGIDRLIDTIDENTKSHKETHEMVKELKGQIDEQNIKFTSVILTGIGLIVGIIITVYNLISKLRTKSKKKTYNEYIDELRDLIKVQHHYFVDQLKVTNRLADRNKIKINELINKSIKVLEKMNVVNKK